jgi:hypothetical protein
MKNNIRDKTAFGFTETGQPAYIKNGYLSSSSERSVIPHGMENVIWETEWSIWVDGIEDRMTKQQVDAVETFLYSSFSTSSRNIAIGHPWKYNKNWRTGDVHIDYDIRHSLIFMAHT